MPFSAAASWRKLSLAFLLILILVLSSPHSAAGQGAIDPDTGLPDYTWEKENLRFQYSEIDGSFVKRNLNDDPPQNEYQGYPPLISLDSYTNGNADTMTDYLRSANPDNTGRGTRNWKKLQHGAQSFTKRNGHATLVYKCPSLILARDGTECIWLIGGRSEEYQAYDLEFTRRNADVYFSADGADWRRVGGAGGGTLMGDFIDGIGNFDAKFPGNKPIAPFYSRFGHSLDKLDLDGDGTYDAMILIGGYSPEPSNDVWISTDGTNWAYDDEAPFTGRAWHATANFNGQLYVIGGAPLTNDVWVGNLTMKTGLTFSSASQSSDMTMSWRQKVSHMHEHTPFSPRSGHCVLSQLRRDSYNSTGDSKTDRLYMIGGFASWPRDDPRYDGERSRNDVYVTSDGKNWTKVQAPFKDDTQTSRYMSMPWAARAWHGCATFHQPNDRSVDINQAAVWEYEKDKGDGDEIMHPKMFIIGGGYIGTKRNHVIRKMEAYVDCWWSRDGTNWVQVNMKDSEGAALFTTQEWAETAVEGVPINIGKWGFTLEVFHRAEDMNGDGKINEGDPTTEPRNVTFDFAGNTFLDATSGAADAAAAVVSQGGGQALFWRKENRAEVEIPALIFVAGDTVDAGGLTNDVFVSKPGILCEKNGITCNERGACGPGTMGCVCESRQWLGEYCEKLNQDYVASAWLFGPGGLNLAMSLIAAALLLC